MRTKPTVQDRKIPRSVSIRESVDKLAKEHGIDVGQITENAILLACGSDPEEIELLKLEQEIRKLKAQLAPKLSRYEVIKESVTRKRVLQTDLTIEKECHAWYLRSLVQSGTFRVMRSDPVDPGPVVSQLLRDGYIKPEDIETANGQRRISGNASRKSRRYLDQFLDANGNITTREGKTWITPSNEDMLKKYQVSLNYDDLAKEIIENTHIGDEPLEFYMQFNPRITSDSVKREIKTRMLPHYSNEDVELKESE